MKKQVTDSVLLDHLTGKKPYGFCPLIRNKTRVIVVDFDTKNRLNPMEFINSCKHYELSAYIERNKFNGYHVWIFFEKEGVLAAKAHLVVRHILSEIEKTDTGIFPKQDSLNSRFHHDSFLNAPLFGVLVPQGKTVFINPVTFEPYPNQWDFLKSVKKHRESNLDDIIEMNNLVPENVSHTETKKQV